MNEIKDMKEYLKSISRLQVLIQEKTEVLKKLNSKANCKGTSYDGDKITGGIHGGQDDLLLEIVSHEKEMARMIEDLSKRVVEAMKLIDKLNSTQSIEVIYKRYLRNERWEVIAVEMNLCTRQVLRIHGQALIDLEKLATPEETK